MYPGWYTRCIAGGVYPPWYQGTVVGRDTHHGTREAYTPLFYTLGIPPVYTPLLYTLGIPPGYVPPMYHPGYTTWVCTTLGTPWVYHLRYERHNEAQRASFLHIMRHNEAQRALLSPCLLGTTRRREPSFLPVLWAQRGAESPPFSLFW